MQSTKKPRVKICCISSVEEARLAIECGASALGLVSAMPSGPGIISDETVTAIAAEVPPPVATFLLTSLQDAASIIVNAGLIGGLDQTGNWKIDARFNRKDLARRIERISRYRDRISLHNVDAAELLQSELPIPNLWPL